MIIINVIAVNPTRGVAQNSTSFKRIRREFWSAYNVGSEFFSEISLVEKVWAVANALIYAATQIPESQLNPKLKLAFCTAVHNGADRISASGTL